MPFENLHIVEIVAFNHDNQKLYRNQEPPKAGCRKVIVLIDVSSSMKSKKSQDEVKLVYQMLRIISGNDTAGLPALLPQPSGTTNLIGLLMGLEKTIADEQCGLLIITDGEDNFNSITNIPTDVNPDTGVRVMTDLSGFKSDTKEYNEMRQRAILQYATNVLPNCVVHLIGIGKECSAVMKVAKSMPIVAAQLPGGSNASQVAAVVGKALRTKPRAKTYADTIQLKPDAADTSPPLYDPPETPIIVLDELPGVDAPAAPD